MARGPPARPEPIAGILLEICVHGRPVSAQTANRRKLLAWKQMIGEAAVRAWANRAPLTDELEQRITHYSEVPSGDLDNLIKPVQDALQGIVFINDRQIRDIRGARHDINAPYVVRFISNPLGAAFADGRPFVHIRVRGSPVTGGLGR